MLNQHFYNWFSFLWIFTCTFFLKILCLKFVHEYEVVLKSISKGYWPKNNYIDLFYLNKHRNVSYFVSFILFLVELDPWPLLSMQFSVWPPSFRLDNLDMVDTKWISVLFFFAFSELQHILKKLYKSDLILLLNSESRPAYINTFTDELRYKSTRTVAL